MALVYSLWPGRGIEVTVHRGANIHTGIHLVTFEYKVPTKTGDAYLRRSVIGDIDGGVEVIKFALDDEFKAKMMLLLG